jgi:ABC-type antimicrobial peptide transport system permease subunit
MKSLLFGVAAIEPAIYVASGAALLAIAVIAAAAPAYRAARVDPMMSLRHE